jgi:hypothetical protein
MPETTSTTRFAHRHAHPISHRALVEHLRGRSSEFAPGGCGINARRGGDAAPRQCQRLEPQSHRPACGAVRDYTNDAPATGG